MKAPGIIYNLSTFGSKEATQHKDDGVHAPVVAVEFDIYEIMIVPDSDANVLGQVVVEGNARIDQASRIVLVLDEEYVCPGGHEESRCNRV